MKEFDKIFLTWRKGVGKPRQIVGVLQKTPDGKHIFKYIQPTVEKLQKEEGFTPYTEFQDITKEYNGNVAEIFGQRLTKTNRPDIQSFFNFWEVDETKAKDKFYLLGKTQGLLATDNFEFLAEYHLSPDLQFLTELASLSQLQLPKGSVQIGDQLRFEKDLKNPSDKFAVKAYKEELFVGYIKKIHCQVFHEPGGENLTITVKAIDQNGYIKRVFIKVSF
jgi:hypothetical protein